MNPKRLITRFSYRICLICSIVVSLVLCGEVIIRETLFDIYKYMLESQQAFILTILLVVAIVVLLYCIFNNIGIATLIMGIFYIGVHIVDYYKYSIKGEHIAPVDLSLLIEATNIAGKFEYNINYRMIWAILCLIWLVLIAYKLKEKMALKVRIVGGMVAVIILIVLIGISMNSSLLGKLNIKLQPSYVNENYEINGLLLTFINRIQELIISKPINYSAEDVLDSLDKEGIIKREDIKNAPNIIMIMSEAFVDVNEFPNIILSENPIKFFNHMQQEFTSGNIITAIFGGSTAQTEYEVLTGNSVDFTGINNIAYTRYIYDKFQSIIHTLNDLDYQTMAIHPYKREFYSRDTVYKKLGIQKFFSEEAFNDWNMIRGFISDEQLTNKIIEEYERNREDNNRPFFVHSVTMQNHGPYISSYTKNNIQVESEQLNEENSSILTEYVNLLNVSDNALKKLVEYFENINEPTVIVFYGDHAPILGNNYSVYKQLEIIKDESNVNENYSLHHTPFVIWNNYGLQKIDYGDIDASYLGAILLKHVSMNYDQYFNHLYNQIKKIKAYNEDFYIDYNGQIKDSINMNSEEIDILNKLWLLQYDKIFGEKYMSGGKND